MLNTDYKVCVLTVTYGNRWHLLQQVLKRLLSLPQVIEIVIVDNASAYDVAAEIARLATDKIKLVRLPENKGSAGGYANAISFAQTNTIADLWWLLDDDNLPGIETLSRLLSHWKNTTGDDNKNALFCLREDRAHHVSIAKGEDPYRYYLTPNNFMGFSVLNIFKNQLLKLRDKGKSDNAYKTAVTIPYTPYGGLFFHRSITAEIGVPDERLFTYVDDSEYTYRITQNGGTIWLVPDCKITDIEQSQGIGYQHKLLHSHLLDQWSFRTYYHVRNRMYFYSRTAVKNKILFKLNKGLYLTYLQAVSLVTSKTNEFKKLKQAVNDGLAGVLGKANDNKF